MTGRNDQLSGPWWSSGTDNTAIGSLISDSPSSSTMHFVKGSVMGTAPHQRPGLLLDTHYAIHFPGAVEGDYDVDSNLSGSRGDNGASSARVPTAMFEKQLTPSDVGKLNRLVIPKQYAERYFPIDPASDEKGLQLSFEDESGKVWRFRYSYWNSSQSYVLTKGWSRYVKDKRLRAGDVVSFHRGDRLYIRYRRSSEDGSPAAAGWGQLVYPASAGPPIFYPRTGDGTATMMGGSPGVESKRVVRLFGVNLDCPAVDAAQPAWGSGV